MAVQLLHHDPDAPGSVSPFDAAMLRIARSGSMRLACPYIGLAYLRRVTEQSAGWRLLSDVEEWLRAQSCLERDRVYNFLVDNRDRIRHYPRLHAKVAVGPRSAMLGSANFTDAGMRRRTEVSAFFQNEPQVQELTEWFDAHWGRAYELDDARLARIATFIAGLPAGAGGGPPAPEIDPLITTQPAGLTPLGGASRSRASETRDGEFYFNYGHTEGWREWDDARNFGFVCAGGGSWFSDPLTRLGPGDRVWVYAPRYGYVGVARVTGSVQPASHFRVRHGGRLRPIMEVVSCPDGYHRKQIKNPELCEYFVPVRWLNAVEQVDAAVLRPGMFATELIVCRPTAKRWHATLRHLRRAFPNYNG